MNKILILVSVLLLFWSNAFSQSSAITEDDAIAKLEEFFYLLDVNRYEKEVFSRVITKDFQIFEDGLDLDRETFHDFISEATGTIVETEWVLSNFKVTLNMDSAHITYYNNGVFKTKTNESIYSYWMESVYMVVENGELKLKFLQSDLINREITEITHE
jgi:hypothetical protein